MPILCPNCHAENRDTSERCSQCGNLLFDAPIPSDPTDRREASLGPSGDQQPRGPSRPDTLPEGNFKLDPRKPKKAEPERLPLRVKIGPPKYPVGLLLLLLLVAVPVSIGAVMQDAVPVLFLIGLTVLVIALSLRSRSHNIIGIVTHLRNTGDGWLFDLCLTDREWHVLKDRKGFTLPVVEVAYRANRLHGPPLEEGSHTVMRAHKKISSFQAKKIWHIPLPAVDAFHGVEGASWGRATGLQHRSAPDMRYPGERSLEVWAFELQLTDRDFEAISRGADGMPLPPLHVEIRAQSISGPAPRDGDKLEIYGVLSHGTLYARDVCNWSQQGAALTLKNWAGVP